jgi:hypothetical protein
VDGGGSLRRDDFRPRRPPRRASQALRRQRKCRAALAGWSICASTRCGSKSFESRDLTIFAMSRQHVKRQSDDTTIYYSSKHNIATYTDDPYASPQSQTNLLRPQQSSHRPTSHTTPNPKPKSLTPLLSTLTQTRPTAPRLKSAAIVQLRYRSSSNNIPAVHRRPARTRIDDPRGTYNHRVRSRSRLFAGNLVFSCA